MAVNQDNSERDPKLARLLETVSREEPPAALDAAILAAARREVSARPQIVGGGAEATTPAPRQKRNWYVPVSIAAVLVMSASLVTLVHQEKGDELSQPPRSAPASAPAPAQAPKAPAQENAAPTKPETALRDAESTQPKLEEARRVEIVPPVVSPAVQPTAVVESSDGYASKQRRQAENPAANLKRSRAESDNESRKEDSPMATAKVAPVIEALRRDAQPAPAVPATVLPEAASRSPGTGVTSGGASAGTGAVPPPAPMRDSRPEPFPAAGTPRTEADRQVTGDMARAAPLVEGRILAVPPPRPTARASAPSLQRSSPQPVPRPAWLVELDNQSPEQWLERLAQFRRDGRAAEADEMMIEFRKRFPTHPASAR